MSGQNVIVPVGFMISTLSVMLLRALVLIARTPTYEAVLSDSTLERIWGQLQSTQARDKKLSLYAATTFDHELLATGIHTWLLRRWNSFNVAAHSIVAPRARSCRGAHLLNSTGLCVVVIDPAPGWASVRYRAQCVVGDDEDD